MPLYHAGTGIRVRSSRGQRQYAAANRLHIQAGRSAARRGAAVVIQRWARNRSRLRRLQVGHLRNRVRATFKALGYRGYRA